MIALTLRVFALFFLLLSSAAFGATASAPLTITLGPSGPSALANGTYVMTLGGSAVDGTSNPPLLSGTTSLAAQQWNWDGFKFDNVKQSGLGNEFLADGGNSLPLMTNTGDSWLVIANVAGWNIQDLNTGSYLTVRTTGASTLPNGNYQFSTTNGCVTVSGGNVSLTALGSCTATGGQLLAWNGGAGGVGSIDGLFDINNGQTPHPIGSNGSNLGSSGDLFTITSVSSGYTIRHNTSGLYLQDSPLGIGATQTVWTASGNTGSNFSGGYTLKHNTSGLYLQDSPFGLGATQTVWTISGQTGGSTLAMVPSGTQTPTVWTIVPVGLSATINPTPIVALDNTGSGAPLATFTCTLSTGPACSPTNWTSSGLPAFASLNASTGVLVASRALVSGDDGGYTFTVSDGAYGPQSIVLNVNPAGGGLGNIQVVQQTNTILYPGFPDLVNSYTLGLSKPAVIGHAIFGAALYENNAGNGAFGGNLDTVYVGSQQATKADDNGWCCGPHEVTFYVLNVNNAAAGITISSSNGGNFLTEAVAYAEISGISLSASIDVHNSQFLHLLAGDQLVSPTVTPSVPGDFLYGAGFSYDFGHTLLSAGPGWTLIGTCATDPACGNAMDPVQEMQLYDSVSPVAAVFVPPTGYSSNETWAGIIAVKNP